MSAEVRLTQLQQLVLDPDFLGLEPLLDLLLGVHQELGASHLAQDKYVADFLRWGEYGQVAWGTVQGRGGSTRQEWAVEGQGAWRGLLVWEPNRARDWIPSSPGGAPGSVRPLMTQPVQTAVGTASCCLCTHTRTWQLSLLGPLTPKRGFVALPGFPECGEGQWGSCQGVAHRQVFGVCLPSCPDRCPGAMRAQ